MVMRLNYHAASRRSGGNKHFLSRRISSCSYEAQVIGGSDEILNIRKFLQIVFTGQELFLEGKAISEVYMILTKRRVEVQDPP